MSRWRPFAKCGRRASLSRRSRALRRSRGPPSTASWKQRRNDRRGYILSDLKTREAALMLLASLGAPRRLMIHAEIVSEVAAVLSRTLHALGVHHDADLVAVGAVIHDAGKIKHPEELAQPGREHETAG